MNHILSIVGDWCMRYFQVVFVLVIILGGILFFSPITFPFIYEHLANLVYDNTPPIISQGSMYPPSSRDNPTPLTTGKTITLQFAVEDPESGLESIFCSIYKVSTSSETLVANITKWTFGQDIWLADWNVPSEKNVLYKFYFKAVNKAGLLSDITTWGTTGVPTGKFYINGKVAEKTSTIYVSSSELTITFKATSMGEYIDKVWIKVIKGSSIETKELTIIKEGEEWKTTYNLKWGTGTYTIEGWIRWRQSEDHHLMSINIPCGVKITTKELIQMLGLILITIGISGLIMTRKTS